MNKIIVAFMFYVCLQPAGTAKPEGIACIVDKYAQYVAAQEKWQRDLTELVLSVHPQFEEVANLYLEDQLTMIELRQLAAEFFAWHAPDKLNLAAPLNQWVSLDSVDEEEIAKTNERYAELLRLMKQARGRAPHPDGDALRKVMRDEVINLPGYMALVGELTAAVARFESIECK